MYTERFPSGIGFPGIRGKSDRFISDAYDLVDAFGLRELPPGVLQYQESGAARGVGDDWQLGVTIRAIRGGAIGRNLLVRITTQRIRNPEIVAASPRYQSIFPLGDYGSALVVKFC
jgi:hypothetical protein